MHLLHRSSWTRLAVAMPLPSPVMPALHVCTYPVEEPEPPRRPVYVPLRMEDPHDVGALATETLYLPEQMLVNTRMMAPPGLEVGLATFWTLLPDVPLTVPVHVLEERQFWQGWHIRTVATPRHTGSSFTPAEQATVGWAVLARADLAAAVVLLARMACLIEIGVHDNLLERVVCSIVNRPGFDGGWVSANSPLLGIASTLRPHAWLVNEC